MVKSYTFKFPTGNAPSADKFLKTVDSISGSGTTAAGQLAPFFIGHKVKQSSNNKEYNSIELHMLKQIVLL